MHEWYCMLNLICPREMVQDFEYMLQADDAVNKFMVYHFIWFKEIT